MKHILPKLPFAYDALEPVITRETLGYHHEMHHRAYVDKLNELIVGTEYEDLELLEIVLKSSGAIFNNAAQSWNHEFYWNSLIPARQARPPTGPLAEALKLEFGSLEKFREDFSKAAIGHFGSGWAWLTRDETSGKLTIETTANAGNPARLGKRPLLVVDLWEHAYYIDYRNERLRYLHGVASLLNWEFAEKRFALKDMAGEQAA